MENTSNAPEKIGLLHCLAQNPARTFNPKKPCLTLSPDSDKTWYAVWSDRI